MYKHSELTRGIIGIAMKVHRRIGPGFQEKIYHRTMKMALEEAGYDVESEKEFDVFYNDSQVGAFRIDLLVNGLIIVELKSVCGEMQKLFYAQTISYLKASNKEVALLINFGERNLEIKRLAHYKNFKN